MEQEQTKQKQNKTNGCMNRNGAVVDRWERKQKEDSPALLS